MHTRADLKSLQEGEREFRNLEVSIGPTSLFYIIILKIIKCVKLLSHIKFHKNLKFLCEISLHWMQFIYIYC